MRSGAWLGLICLLFWGCDDGGDADPEPEPTVEAGVDGSANTDATTADGQVDLATSDMTPAADMPRIVDAVVDQAIDMQPDMGRPDPNATFLGEWCLNDVANFSFFVVSMNALWTRSGHAIDDWTGGLGGDLGGIEGADEMCQLIGQATGHGHKTWRAFLSVTRGPDGQPIHAIDRIGEGPWYDANGRLVSEDLAGLLAGDRPRGDAATINDLPDECGVPLSALGDSHDTLTGSNQQGRLASDNPEHTCNNWTSSSDDVGVNAGGRPRPGEVRGVMIGHSWPRGGAGGGGRGGANWMSDHATRGCGKGANLLQDGPGSGTCVGCAGGYGQWYCFSTDGGSM